MAESFKEYAQPLIDATDGSMEEIRKTLNFATICWNLALLPPFELYEALSKMAEKMDMDEAGDDFINYCADTIFPMLIRHKNMFPALHGDPEEFVPLDRDISKKKYTGTGRNDLCPCGSGKKYKRCCGQ